MTHPKITMKADLQPDAAGGDFAALADQLIQDAWHLPPEGDQSWREQDARRIFRGDGKHDINDGPPAQEEDDAPRNDAETPPEPVFQPPRVVGVLLPLALATVIVFFTVAFSAPEILTGRFWTAPEPEVQPQAATMPVNLASAAPVQTTDTPGELRPSLARDERAEATDAIRAADNAGVRKPAPLEFHHAVSDAREWARHKTGVAVRVGSTSSFRQLSLRARPSAKRLPPIGAAYFASHTPAVAVSKTAAADWKMETARWDETAAKIRARREKYQKTGDIAAAEAASAREIP